MDLSLIQDAFDRVSKKQKVCYSKTQDVIDRTLHELEVAAKQLSETSSTSSTSSSTSSSSSSSSLDHHHHCSSATDHKLLLTGLQSKLTELAPSNQVAALQKDVNLAVSKYGKILDKAFCIDIAKAYREAEFDGHLINEVVAVHFYRQGLFDLGDCFVQETQEPNAMTLKTPFFEMYQNLEQLRARNLVPALNWARENRPALQKKGSSLEFQLHQLQFVHILHNIGRAAALQYARASFGPFASGHINDIQRLMGCLLWAGRLEASPYSDLLAPSHWDTVALEFTRECCNLLGQAYESPLQVTVSAGSQALPTILKLATVMANKKQEWQAMKQLPVETPLDNAFQFHSIFACPVSREQSTAENPPMLMNCGHVLCKQSIQKLVKGNSRTFKCPYCPLETTSAQCRQIYF